MKKEYTDSIELLFDIIITETHRRLSRGEPIDEIKRDLIKEYFKSQQEKI